MANSEDHDEMARDEPSHLDLHCLHRYPFWSVWLKELIPFRYYRDVSIQIVFLIFPPKCLVCILIKINVYSLVASQYGTFNEYPSRKVSCVLADV